SRFAAPNPKLPVVIEVDNPPAQPVVVELGFDAAGNDRFYTRDLLGFRAQRIGLHAAGPDGAVVFRTDLGDWIVGLDTSEIYGARRIRVQLFELNGGKKGKKIPLVDEQAPGDELFPLFDAKLYSNLAPLTFDTETNAVFANIMLDGTPPEKVAFVAPPKTLA